MNKKQKEKISDRLLIIGVVSMLLFLITPVLYKNTELFHSFWAIYVFIYSGGIMVISSVARLIVKSIADTPDSIVREREEAAKLRKKTIMEAYAAVISAIVNADNKTQEEEKNIVRRFVNKLYKTDEERDTFCDIYKHINHKNVAPVLDTLNAYIKHSERVALIEMLFSVIIADEIITDKEWDTLQTVLIKLAPADVEEINYLYTKYKARHRYREEAKANQHDTQNTSQQTKQQQNNIAYATLGLTAQASQEEIHNAYIKLAKRYHPDTVQDENLKEMMAEKFKEIKKAYEELRSKKYSHS
ncbi:MAG: DnaJ domain-containing protein [Paludibacteraceae bacterium]|nr:DnaJ domain-containing protein [Paludibacteraceae bacterium]